MLLRLAPVVVDYCIMYLFQPDRQENPSGKLIRQPPSPGLRTETHIAMASLKPIDLAELSAQQKHAQKQAVAASPLATLVRMVEPSWWRYLLVVADGLLILVAFSIAYYIRYQLQWFRAVDPAFQLSLLNYAPFALTLAVMVLFAFRFSGVYPYRPGRSPIEEMYAIGAATTLGVVVLIAISLTFRQVLYSRLIYLYTAVLVTILLGCSRLAITLALSYLRHYGIGVRRVLLVGAGEVGRMIMRTVAARPDLGYQLVGFMDDHPAKGATDIGPFRALGPIDNLEPVLAEQQADSVIICLPWQSHRMIQRILRTCEQAGVRAQVVPDFFQLTKEQIHVEVLNGIPLLSTRVISIQGWNFVVKRITDLVLVIGTAVVALPLMGLIALAIRLDSPGPVLYAQWRTGRNGKPFRCYKFRSMVNGAEEMQHTLAGFNQASGPLFKVRDDPRRTRVGRFLRRFSLDELPQLYNVLRGEMSLIGPRPNLPHEVEQYEEWHKKRLVASPGITGLWQVSGRSDLTFDEMVLLDIYYVENWSLALDLSLLLRSLPAVLLGRGAY
jgi:exopolysaccharide biosynthesis polyprenyl glycosylphosphotransferase